MVKKISRSVPPASRGTRAREGGKKAPENGHDFLAVGVGASAGGIRALKEFFSSLPDDPGMAFIVVLHLSPTHKSNLDAILQTATAMPVIQVQGATKVEPNHVYVIPPNRNLVMVDGTVRTTRQLQDKGTRVAIDLLFRTLSEAYGRNAICVVLSGTGTDGTLGLRAVKGRTGFAMVQDPKDAEYDGMPESAIRTKLVDVILPAREMGPKLMSVRDSTERFQLHEEEEKPPALSGVDALREILTVVRVRTGHDFSTYKHPTLLRRIARHLQIHDLDDMGAYLDLLREKPEEVESLVHNLLINVTNFFRDAQGFEALETSVIPKLFAGKSPRDQVRVWVAGCASGEEAYSIAILLSEYADTLNEPPKIQVFASDVDDEAIESARHGRFVEAIATDISAERLKRFFVKEGPYYRVKKALREMVLFAPHNVLRDPPFSRVDMVSCRNLLIYLNRESQDAVQQIFHFALVEDGFLFLGSAETAEGQPTLFTPFDKRNRIYSKRPAASSLPHLSPARFEVPKRNDEPPESRAESGQTSPSFAEMHYKLIEQYAPPSMVVDEDFNIVHLSAAVGKYLKFGGGAPTHNINKVVIPDLLPDLRAALFAAQHDHKTADVSDVTVEAGGETFVVNLHVRPIELPEFESTFLLIVIEEKGRELSTHPDHVTPSIADGKDALAVLARRLEGELRRTKERLRSTIEQNDTSVEELKASNEELQAINEELRSTTEELETSKEELQSVNEELTTVNNELKVKVDEVTRAHADLQNLMQATDIATIFLDRDLRIQRFTEPAAKIFNIIGSDLGRPLTDLTNQLNGQDFLADISQVLSTLHRTEREVSSAEGRIYLARFSPYRSAEDKIEGVVITFIDISHRKQAEIELAEKEAELHTVTEMTPLILIRVGADRKYRFINAAGAALFGRPADEMIGHSLSSVLGRKGIAKLKPYIDRVLAGEHVEFESEMEYPAAGPRVMQISYIPELGESGTVNGWLASIVDITELRRAQQAERESEARFRILSDTVPALAWFDDDEGNCRFVNQRFLDFCGKTIDEIRGDKWRLVLHPDDAPDYLAEFAKAQKRRSQFHAKVRIRRHDGEWRWIESFASPLMGDDGKYLGHVGISPDITDRVESEDRLRLAEGLILASRNQMRLITDALPALISYVDANQRYRFANRTYKHWFGIDPASAVGRHVREVFGTQAYQFLKPHIESALAGKQSDFEGDVEYKDGTVRSVHGSYVPDTDDEGRVVGYFGVTMDVSALKRSEELLRSSEEKLSLIMESFTDYAILSLDTEGKVQSWNAGAKHIFGYSEEEIIGNTADIIFTPEDRKRGVPEKERRTARRKGRALDERWHIRRDGSRFYASGVMMPLYLGKKLSGYAKIATDLTERQQQAEALQRAHDELEVRVGERTRELAETNQALIAEARARNASEEHRIMLLRRLISSQEMERSRIARDIHDQLGQRLTGLRLKLQSVAGTLTRGDDSLPADFADLQAMAAGLDAEVGFLAWELRPAALDDLGLVDALKNFVNEWSKHYGTQAIFHSIKIGKTRFDEEIETHLYRIGQEALNNISKHARATKVNVVLEKRDDQLLLIIEDNGSGFDVEKLKAPRRSGRGLGLLGMRERTALVGGEFDIESTPGTGTTVYVRVPAFG